MAPGLTSSNGGTWGVKVAFEQSDFLTSRDVIKKIPDLQENIVAGIKEDLFPREISIFVNRKCFNNCSYCYVNYSDKKEVLSSKDWGELLSEVKTPETKAVCIVGKEPLATLDHTKSVLESIKKVKNEEKVGLVTSLRKLGDNAWILFERIEEDIDFLDVSLDGFEKENDSLRGFGSFREVTKNFKKLKSLNLNYKTPILSTITSRNIENYPNFISWAHDYLGADLFVITPIIAVDKKHNSLRIRNKELNELIIKLQELTRNLKIEIILKIDTLTTPVWVYLSRTYNTFRVLQDHSKSYFWDLTIDSSLGSFLIALRPYPEQFWYHLRISESGRVSGCPEMFSDDFIDRSFDYEKGQFKNKLIEVISSNEMKNLFDEYKREVIELMNKKLIDLEEEYTDKLLSLEPLKSLSSLNLPSKIVLERQFLSKVY